MKKIYILFLTCTSLFSISCSSFLEEDPRDGLLGDNAYSTLPALYRNCVASLYNCVGSYKDSEGLQGTGRGIYDLNTFTTDEAKGDTRITSEESRFHQFRKAGVFLLTGIGWKQRGTKDTLTDRVRLLVVAEGVRNV